VNEQGTPPEAAVKQASAAVERWLEAGRRTDGALRLNVRKRG
jgi:hypothetical protein